MTLIAFGGCVSSGEDSPYELSVWLNNYAGDSVEFWLDGEPVEPASGTQGLTVRTWESYDEALVNGSGVTIESRGEDGTMYRCVVHPGACADACVPERETASVCASENGELMLNTWSCPCDGIDRDYSCNASCSVTGPQ